MGDWSGSGDAGATPAALSSGSEGDWRGFFFVFVLINTIVLAFSVKHSDIDISKHKSLKFFLRVFLSKKSYACLHHPPIQPTPAEKITQVVC